MTVKEFFCLMSDHYEYKVELYDINEDTHCTTTSEEVRKYGVLVNGWRNADVDAWVYDHLSNCFTLSVIK